MDVAPRKTLLAVAAALTLRPFTAARRVLSTAGWLAVAVAICLGGCGTQGEHDDAGNAGAESSRAGSDEARPSAAAPPGGEAQAQAREDERAVVEAHRTLIAAYEAGDVYAFVSLLDPSPSLLIFHPLLESRFDTIAQVREGLGKMFEHLGGASWTDAHALVTVWGDVAWVTSHMAVEAPGLSRPFIGRGTEIWVRDAGSWRLTHAHWSADPEAEYTD
jgi:ketosteroid isomerase-like protein